LTPGWRHSSSARCWSKPVAQAVAVRCEQAITERRTRRGDELIEILPFDLAMSRARVRRSTGVVAVSKTRCNKSSGVSLARVYFLGLSDGPWRIFRRNRNCGAVAIPGRRQRYSRTRWSGSRDRPIVDGRAARSTARELAVTCPRRRDGRRDRPAATTTAPLPLLGMRVGLAMRLAWAMTGLAFASERESRRRDRP
jgi:hypothetical protein